MPPHPLKPRLLELVESTRADAHSLAERLGVSTRNAESRIDRWVPRDHLAHIDAWERHFCNILESIATAAPLPPSNDDYQSENDRIYLANRDRALPTVLARLDETCADLTRRLEAFTEDQLSAVGIYPRRPSQSLQDMFVGNAFVHPQLHIAYCYLEHGDKERAQAINERLARTMIEFDDSDQNRGNAYYNLACYYALAGESGWALSLLNDSFALNADLLPWSRQDPDLVSLRELPAFLALYV